MSGSLALRPILTDRLPPQHAPIVQEHIEDPLWKTDGSATPQSFCITKEPIGVARVFKASMPKPADDRQDWQVVFVDRHC